MKPNPPDAQRLQTQFIAFGDLLLWAILPDEGQTLLLRACLHEGTAARRAWLDWLDAIGEPSGTVPFFGQFRKRGLSLSLDKGDSPHFRKRQRKWGQSPGGAIRNLLPLLARNAERTGPHDQELAELMRAARFREELRARTVARIVRQVLAGLADEGITPVVLGGVALVHTVYDAPADRHCGGIHLLVTADELERSAETVGRLEFRASSVRTPRLRPLRFAHATGLPLTLQDRLFDVPDVDSHEPPDSGAGTGPCEIAGLPARVLGPADALAWTCTRAFFGEGRGLVTWAADAWMIIRRPPGPHWPTLLDLARRRRLRRPIGLMLGYLADSLGAPVPADVLAGLRCPIDEERADRRLALLGAVHAVRTDAGTAWRRARGLSPFRQPLAEMGTVPLVRSNERDSPLFRNGTKKGTVPWLFLLRAWLLPPPDYLRWRHGIRGPLVPLYYVWLPLRHLVRRLTGRSPVGR